MEYRIDFGIYNGIFAVPTSIADEHIKAATGDNLKVLLYCLRHSGIGLSVGQISHATGAAPDNVTSSLEFWQQRGLFNLHTDVFTPTAGANHAAAALGCDYEYSAGEIADVINGSKDVAYFFERCEEIYGRLLKPNEQKAFAVIIEEYGMKPAVALMLVGYCVSVGKAHTRYIKTTALNWIDEGINTVALAEAHMEKMRVYNDKETELRTMLSVHRIPDSKKPLFKKWLYDFKFTPEIIYDAYQIALEKTGKTEYTYMDKILADWNKHGISSKADRLAHSQANRKKFDKPGRLGESEGESPSFDLEAFNRKVMEKYKKVDV
jgi:DnaD/phage-associated family protein